MIGGTVIESKQDGKRWRLWVVGTSGSEKHDELAIHTSTKDGKQVKPGDSIWWQGANIYWSPKNGNRKDIPLIRAGYSHDPIET